jgi:beta-galactosidase GanA
MSTLAEREFLLSGEFHYFRVPRGEWRNRLDTMAAAGLRTASIYVPWNWHAPAPDVTDFTGKEVAERDLPGALREIAAAGLECVFRPGPFITAEWRNGGIPDWLLRGDLLALDARGRPAGGGAAGGGAAGGGATGTAARRAYPVLTYSHPEYQARARSWLEQALAVARDSGPIANIQLDDEPSYWRTLLEPLAADYNPFLVGHQDGPSRYARWLLDRHGSLDAINRAYRASHARPEDLEPPREPAQDYGQALRHLDWLEFKLAETNRQVEFLYEVVGEPASLLHPYLLPWSAVRCGDFIRERNLPIQLTNECYLALFTGSAITEAKLGAVLACHETYHMWRDPATPPVTIEIQGSNASYLSAGAMELLYALSAARGIRGVNYYMMAGGTNPPGFEHITGAEYDIDAPIAKDGTTRPHYDVISKFSKIMGGWLGQRLAGAVPLRDVWIGCYAPYEMAAITGAAQPLGMAGLAETFDGGDIGMSAASSLTALMALNSVSFGCLDLEKELPAQDVPQLWVPGGTFMAADVQQRLADYVRAGGQLVLLPDVPALDSELAPCRILSDLLGGPDLDRREGESFVIYGDGGETLAATGSLTTLEAPPGSTILARTAPAGDGATGRACAVTREVGAGRITFLGFGLRYLPTAGRGQHDFLLRIAPPRKVWTSGLPFAAFQLQGPDAGLLCVANPLEQAGETRVRFRAEGGAGDGDGEPNGEEEVTVRFSGRGAVLLPVNVRLTGPADGDITLRYATSELLDVEVAGGHATLTFAPRDGELGEARVTTGRSDKKLVLEPRLVLGDQP